MKKIAVSLLIVCIMLAMYIPATAANVAAARRVGAPIFVDGVQAAFPAYDINGSTYIAVRDLSNMLSGSPNQFSVTWHGAQNAIRITTNQQPYTTGTEQPWAGAERVLTSRADINVFLDGSEIHMRTYNIEGRNFSRLRDICIALDFFLWWDASRGAIVINTNRAYVGPDDSESYDPVYSTTGISDRGIDPSKPMVALTFDDGPSWHTSAILDILEEHGVPATFFVIGRLVEPNREIVLRAFNMGSEIGNHSWSHPNLARQSEARVHAELLDTNNAIESVIGVPPLVFRAPFGSVNGTVRRVSANLGLPIISWSVDPRDWSVRNADSIYNHIMNNVGDRGIILCHDTYATTVAAMRRVIPDLIARGYQLVTVSELMYYSGITLEPGLEYSTGR